MKSEYKILLVDDDPFILQAFQRTLRKHFDISTASSGLEALELIKGNGPFALVVSDLNMPGMSGIEFLGEVRRISPDTVRVIFTGTDDQLPGRDVEDKGLVFRSISKVGKNEELVKAIKEGLEIYRSRVVES